MSRYSYLLPAALASLISACTLSGPDYTLPKQAMINDERAKAGFDSHDSAHVSTAELPKADWWTLYQDPKLTDLLEQALEHNTDLRVAYHTLKQAYEGQVMAENANSLMFDANAAAGRGQLSTEGLAAPHTLPVMNLGDANLGVNYQVDLFGKLKRATEAATATTQAQAALLASTRLTIMAEVTHNYLQSCHASHELGIAKKALAIQSEQTQVVKSLYEGGRETAVALAQAQAEQQRREAALPPIETKKATSLYQLAALLGRTPGDLPADVKNCSHAPTLSQPIPVGDGSMLLKRRPDVHQAERQLASATAQIGVATAEMYPEITLGAHFGYTGMLEHMGDSIANSWSLMPSIKWHIPTEVDRARIRAREAGADAALAKFDGVVVNALRETQTAISHYQHSLTRLSSLKTAEQAAQQAAEDNRRLYREGRLNYRQTLETDRDLAQSQAAVAECEAQIATHQVQLFLALGGGWHDEMPKAPNPLPK